MRNAAKSGSTEDPIALAADALFRLGRSFARLPAAGDAGADLDRSVVHVTLAVEAGTTGDATNGAAVTIGSVAAWLDVDASTASRLVAGAVAAGMVERRPGRADRRQAELRLTDGGRHLAADARAWRRQVFDALTRDWTDDDRATFARLLPRFVDDVIAVTARHDQRQG